MNISSMLQHFFENSSFNAIKDKRRLKAVLDCTEALSHKETLTLTGLGRAITNTSTKTKHNQGVRVIDCDAEQTDGSKPASSNLSLPEAIHLSNQGVRVIDYSLMISSGNKSCRLWITASTSMTCSGLIS